MIRRREPAYRDELKSRRNHPDGAIDIRKIASPIQRCRVSEARDTGGMDFRNMGLDKNKSSLLKEIEELENEIAEIEKSIPPHSVRYEIIQLLEEKEGELKRKKDLLRSINDVKRG